MHVRPENDSPEVGLLREGATVTVTACQPDCGAPHAWALLGADGALKLEMLAPRPLASEQRPNRHRPPRLPEGWSTIDPRAAGLTSLWVRVERKASLNQVQPISQATPTRRRNALSFAATGD